MPGSTSPMHRCRPRCAGRRGRRGGEKIVSRSLTLASATLGELVKNGEDHVLLIDVGPADRIELAVESIGKTFSKITRQATVI